VTALLSRMQQQAAGCAAQQEVVRHARALSVSAARAHFSPQQQRRRPTSMQAPGRQMQRASCSSCTSRPARRLRSCGRRCATPSSSNTTASTWHRCACCWTPPPRPAPASSSTTAPLRCCWQLHSRCCQSLAWQTIGCCCGCVLPPGTCQTRSRWQPFTTVTQGGWSGCMHRCGGGAGCGEVTRGL
jgi:hypothetical protein